MSARPRLGQTVIELVLALIGTALLFLGTVQIWAWLMGSLVWRQVAYERTRCVAGNPPGVRCGAGIGEPGKADYYPPQPLDIFGPGSGPVGPPDPPPGPPPPPPPVPVCPPDAVDVFNACVRICLRCSDPNGLVCSACFGEHGCCTVGTDVNALCRAVAGCPP